MQKDTRGETPTTDLKHTEDYIKQAELHLKADDVQKAIQTIKAAESKILEGALVSIDKEISKESQYDHLHSFQIVKSLMKDEELIFICEDNYKKIYSSFPDRSHEGVDNWFFLEDSLQTITISGRSTVLSSLMNMVACLSETDILKDRIKHFEEIAKIKEVTLTRWFANCKIKMPLFVSHRETLILGFGLFNQEEKYLMIPFRTVDKEDRPEEYPGESSKHVQIHVNFGFYVVKHLDERHCELFACFNVNPNVAYTPYYLVNKFMKEFGYYVIRDLKALAEDDKLRERLAGRIKEKEFYRVIERFYKV